jgi:hypothetical protein
MRLKSMLAGLVYLLPYGWAAPAAAAPMAPLVIPNGRANTVSAHNVNGVFAHDAATSVGFQIDYAASQLSTVAIGTPIIGLGFRLSSFAGTINQALSYSDFTIDIGQAATTIAGLSRNFLTNEGADTVVSRSGPLTIASGTFVGNRRINPFYEINFIIPYVYEGGDLLITILDSETGTLPILALDAVQTSATLGDVGSQSTQTRGAANFFYAPVTQLYFGSLPIPEPSSWAVVMVGCGLVGAMALGSRGRLVR